MAWQIIKAVHTGDKMASLQVQKISTLVLTAYQFVGDAHRC